MTYHPKKMRYKKGFTLFELLIYIATISILMLMVLDLYFALAHARAKQQSVAEVEEQGQSALALMLADIRNANSITAPAAASSGTSLTLVTYATTTSPTIFSLSGNALQISENGTVAPLTNAQVVVSNLLFRNVSDTNSIGSVQIQFTLAHASTTRAESVYSTTFEGSATIRRITQ